jgi:prephenate dehydratase
MSPLSLHKTNFVVKYHEMKQNRTRFFLIAQNSTMVVNLTSVLSKERQVFIQLTEYLVALGTNDIKIMRWIVVPA